MDGIVSFGNKRSYDEFKDHIPKQVQPMFDSVREYCLSLGTNVIEDVRMHRVVFCKSMSFRWFVDVEPNENSILVKIQKNRKETIKSMKIGIKDELDLLKNEIKDAYQKIR